MNSSRLGSPVSSSCSARWRMSSSVSWRSKASPSTLASDWTKSMSPARNPAPSPSAVRARRTAPHGPRSAPSARCGRRGQREWRAREALLDSSRDLHGGALRIVSRPESGTGRHTALRAVASGSPTVERNSKLLSPGISSITAPISTPSSLVRRSGPPPASGRRCWRPPRVLTEAGHSGLLGGPALELASTCFCSVISDMTPCQRGRRPRRSTKSASSRAQTTRPSRCRSRYSAAPPRLAGDHLDLRFDHPGAIGGVKPGRPQARVGAPLLGGEAEDRLDLRADVVPGSARPRVGGVEIAGTRCSSPALSRGASVVAAVAPGRRAPGLVERLDMST